MTNTMSNLMFNGMAMWFKLRDLASPPRITLEEAGLKPGDRLLDYGCGPGGYVADAAEMVGAAGAVYALDMHPLALQRVQRIATRRGLANVETIHSDCGTGLPDNYLDVVLLYDVFHMLDAPRAVLAEMHRILKPAGTLSFSDHHMSRDGILTGVTASGLFACTHEGQKTYTFAPRDPS